MIKFSVIFSEINLIVVSEKIIKNNPIKNVEKRSLEKFKLSFEEVINKNGTNIKTGIYVGIIILL